MTEQTERTIEEVVYTLANARQTLADLQAIYDEDLAQWQAQHSLLISSIDGFKATVRALEAEIRTRGAAIADETRQPPCPGTKVRNQRVIRYEQPDANGELIAFSPQEQDQLLTAFAVNHGWYGMVKPHRWEIEEVLKSLDDTELPAWARLGWETVVSIDRDLSSLLHKDDED